MRTASGTCSCSPAALRTSSRYCCTSFEEAARRSGRLENRPVIRCGLLQANVVLDGFHSADATRHGGRLVDLGARLHEATQLDHALERLDIDLRRTQRGFIEDGCLHLGGDGRVVDV